MARKPVIKPLIPTGEALYKARRMAGLSLPELAARARIGVDTLMRAESMDGQPIRSNGSTIELLTVHLQLFNVEFNDDGTDCHRREQQGAA